MQEVDNMLDHTNKVKSLVDELMCLEVPIKEEDVAMTLLKSLLPSYAHFMLSRGLD